MATYIPGLTDTPAQRLSFKPDWNRVERGLMLRSAAYEEGARKVKSLYDSMFQSAMLREDNIERRDAYLKDISEGLKSVSALDLSIPQNQENAMQLFQPLNNDKMIVKDIMFTKEYLKESQRAEQMRTSSNPEVRRQYWETGMKAMQYKAEEFKNADPNAAMSMSAAKYVPNVDIVSLANKMYKDMGISVTQDVITGGYIWTKKNGDIAMPLTQSMVNMLFAQDPAIKDMLRTKAYVQRKDYISQRAGALGSEELAEQEYVREVLGELGDQQANQVVLDNEEVLELRSEKDAWDKIISSRGIVPDSDEHKKYLETLEKLKAAEAAAAATRDNTPNLATIDMNDMASLREAADNSVVLASFADMSKQIATLMAYKNTSITAKSDPIYMAKLNSQLALSRAMTMENIRQINRISMLDERQKRGMTGDGTSKTDKKEQERQNLRSVYDQLFGNSGISGNTGGSANGATPDDVIDELLNEEN